MPIHSALDVESIRNAPRIIGRYVYHTLSCIQTFSHVCLVSGCTFSEIGFITQYNTEAGGNSMRDTQGGSDHGVASVKQCS